MSQLRWSRLSRRRLLLAATVALYPACGGGDGGGLTEPTTGALQVATNTSGAVPDQDGYTLSVDDVESGAIGPAAQRTIADLESGAHRIALSGVSANCEVQGQNPRAVSVVAGQTASETFAIVCTQPPPVTGGLSVTTATSGVSPDSDGYTVTVDGNVAGPISAEGSLAVADLGAGDHLVGLAGVAANCAVAGTNSRTVAVVAGAVVSVAFTIECQAPPPAAGTLTVTTRTSGDGADPDGYAFAIGDGDAQPIGASASVNVGGVAAGATQVALSGLADNCGLEGANPRPVTVPAGGAAEVVFAVTCSAGTGALVVTTESTGAPADPNGYAVSVDGGAGVVIGGNATHTFQDLAPGVHTVSLAGLASNCSVQGQNPRSATVSASETTSLTFSVTCAATTGGLTVTVSGLPAGAEAAVTVTGPGGFHRDVAATTTLADLAPGDYTVTAASVTASGSTYTPSPSTTTMEVEAGASATVTVTYAATAGPTLNLSIAGLHLTQSVQTFDNTVPLVSGRDALLRVTALANGSNRVRPQVRVRLYRGNTEVRSVVIESPADTVPTGRLDGEITTTWNTLVEGSLVEPGLRVVAEVDPANTVPEADESDNVFPASGRLAMDVRTPPPLAITLVPVRQAANDLQGDVTASNRRQYLDLASRMYPLPDYSAFVRDVYTTSAPALQPDDANGGWLTVLNEIAALRAADPEVRALLRRRPDRLQLRPRRPRLHRRGRRGRLRPRGRPRADRGPRAGTHLGPGARTLRQPHGSGPELPLSQRQDRTDRLGSADRAAQAAGAPGHHGILRESLDQRLHLSRGDGLPGHGAGHRPGSRAGSGAAGVGPHRGRAGCAGACLPDREPRRAPAARSLCGGGHRCGRLTGLRGDLRRDRGRRSSAGRASVRARGAGGRR